MRRVLTLALIAAVALPAVAQDRLSDARREAAEAARKLDGLEAARAKATDEIEKARLERATAAAGIEQAEAVSAAATLRLAALDAKARAEREALQKAQGPAASLVAALVALDRRPPLAALVEGGGRADDLVRIEAMLNAMLPTIRAESRALAERVARADRARAAAADARAKAESARTTLAQRREAFVKLERAAEARAETLDKSLFGARSEAVLSAAELADLDDAAARGARAAREGRRIASQPLSPLSPFLAERSAADRRERGPTGYTLPADASVDQGLGSIGQAGIRSRGIRLTTKRGDRLVAPAAGEVIFAGPFRGHDGLIAIDHGGGWISLIVDASPDVERGSAVRAGQPIGKALGPVRVELRHKGADRSAALIAGSSD